MTEVNPFESPTSDRVSATPIPASHPQEERPLLWWTVCYVVNLPVCTYLGLLLCQPAKSGEFGMLAGILLMHALGWIAHGRWPDAMRSLRTGSWVVAAAQVFPCLQVIAGMIAIFILGFPAGRFPVPGAAVTADLVTLVAVILTGTQLMVASLLFGLIIRAMTGR